MPDIINVVLDINNEHKDYAAYRAMPTLEKIQYLKNRMIAICNELKKTHPDDTWVISWREYGLAETISNSMKKHLKAELSEVSQKFPNLTIVAGTTATFKKTNIIKSKEILSYYKDLKEN